jgi:uncharacterized protein (TIGR00369 family)
MTPQDIQTLYDTHFAPWVQDLAITVETVSPDHCIFRMPLGDHLNRVGGIVSGQALAALADTCMVLATIVNANEFKPFATTNLDTQFLRPGVGSAIMCRAEVVRKGRALIFARADMQEETSGKLVAQATATFYAP